MCIHREMHLRKDLLCRLSALRFCPGERRIRVWSLRVWRQTNRIKMLQESNQRERHFTVRKLTATSVNCYIGACASAQVLTC